MIENKLFAKQLEDAADNKKQVGRVARLDDVEAVFQKNLPAQHEAARERDRVLDRISLRAFTFDRQVIAPDRYAVDSLELAFESFSGGTNDGDGIARISQSSGFLPYAPVERTGQIFNQDQNPSGSAIPRRHNGRPHLPANSFVQTRDTPGIGDAH